MTTCAGGDVPCRAPNGLILVQDFRLPDRFNYAIKGIATQDGNDSNDSTDEARGSSGWCVNVKGPDRSFCHGCT